MKDSLNWNDCTSHRKFFDNSKTNFRISYPIDWCRLKKEDVVQHGGQKLLQHWYNNSLYKVQRVSEQNNGFCHNKGEQQIKVDLLDLAHQFMPCRVIELVGSSIRASKVSALGSLPPVLEWVRQLNC